MPNSIVIKKKLKNFNKKIIVSGDKSISIRWVLLASLANGNSKAQNLLISEDVKAAIKTVRKLGIKVILNSKFCKIYGKGIDGFKYKKNLTLNAENSGTLGRLILGLLINTAKPIKLIGDKSLSTRDFKRISDPLSKFGGIFKLKNKKNLPLTIYGSKNLKPISYSENKGSAQCKSAVIFAGMRTNGTTLIKAKKSRNHTENLLGVVGAKIKVKKLKKGIFWTSSHPIAGSEVSGPENGVKNLFLNKWCILIKEKNTNKKHLLILTKFWKKIGSKVAIMDSKKHDTVFSMTSHLPHLIAYNLVKTATDFEKRQKYELIKFSAGGLRDFSRIAASNEIMWRDIFFNNQKNISKVIDLFIKNLRSFKRDIQSKNNKSIIKKLVNTKKVRKKIIKLKQDINKPDFGRN